MILLIEKKPPKPSRKLKKKLYILIDQNFLNLIKK